MTNTKSTSSDRKSDSGRLDATAWTEAALEMLAIEGIAGVRVETLAKRLKVTKGSFYWHFADREALYDSMLAHWRRKTTFALIERLDRHEETPAARLHRLLRLPMIGQRSAWAADVELAVRLWGRRSPKAAAALEEVDQLRLRYIGQLLQQCGFSAEEAAARAIIAYSYIRVSASLINSTDTTMMALCEAAIVELTPTLGLAADANGRALAK